VLHRVSSSSSSSCCSTDACVCSPPLPLAAFCLVLVLVLRRERLSKTDAQNARPRLAPFLCTDLLDSRPDAPKLQNTCRRNLARLSARCFGFYRSLFRARRRFSVLFPAAPLANSATKPPPLLPPPPRPSAPVPDYALALLCSSSRMDDSDIHYSVFVLDNRSFFCRGKTEIECAPPPSAPPPLRFHAARKRVSTRAFAVRAIPREAAQLAS